jgi:hypothetical protein
LGGGIILRRRVGRRLRLYTRIESFIVRRGVGKFAVLD